MGSSLNSENLGGRLATGFATLYLGAVLAIYGGGMLFGGEPASKEDPPAYYGVEGPLVIGGDTGKQDIRQIGYGLAAIFFGIALVGCGLQYLERSRPRIAGDAQALRTAHRVGQPLSVLHSDETLSGFQFQAQRRHQRKLLWSLPFWMTTLWFLVLGKGQFDSIGLFGISNLWLMGMTLAGYFVYCYFHWRCPACDAHLPRYHARLTCNECGAPLAEEVRIGSLSEGELEAIRGGGIAPDES